MKSLRASILNFQIMRTKLNGQGSCERVNLKEEGWLFFLQKEDYLLGVKVGESATARKAVILSRTFSHSMVAEGTELRPLKPHLGAI